MAESPTEKQDPRLQLAHKKFLIKSSTLTGIDKKQLRQEILAGVYENDLAPTYEHLCQQLGWPVDQAKLAEMKAKNVAKLAELDAKIKDAEENLGETEVRDAVQARAEYLGAIGDRAAAATAYADAESRTASSGSKTDLVFSQIRLAMLHDDWKQVKAQIARAKQFCEEGGDWEHKNKLKVYEAVFCMYSRDFKRAADLFLDSTATFTTSELFPYSRCIFYAVLTSLIALDRPALKKRVIDSPEILSVIQTLPHLRTFLHSLYYCKYDDFFRAFVAVADDIRGDEYLHPHLRYYMREIRIAAYTQFLESYLSVTLDSMATAFDVSVPFLDEELSEFIVSGRLNAKIDKVAGIVETNRPDARNALYQESIRKGDLLLNRIQKLSRVIDVE